MDTERETLKVANFFNEYYSQVGISVSNPSDSRVSTSESLNRSTTSLYLCKITSKEVEDIISGLKGKTAPGHDGIKTDTNKSLKQFISKPLSYIYNLCIKKGIFPNQFKHAVVSPIYKQKGPSQFFQNYRPISLLTSFAKIFERCLKRRITKFLEENKVIRENQFGFQKGKSTSDAILQLVEGIYPVLDKGQRGAAVMMDLSKAFDLVDHAKLLEILYRVGINGVPLKLFQIYLSGRTQQVKLSTFSTQKNNRGQNTNNKLIKTETFSSIIVNEPYSVPAGTVLSPNLYNVLCQ